MCIPVEPINGCQVIWPNFNGGDAICDCGTIKRCSFINSTGYTVDVPSVTPSKIKICWRNLTEDKNLTRVFVVERTRYNSVASNSTRTRKYLSAYIAIIAGIIITL